MFNLTRRKSKEKIISIMIIIIMVVTLTVSPSSATEEPMKNMGQAFESDYLKIELKKMSIQDKKKSNYYLSFSKINESVSDVEIKLETIEKGNIEIDNLTPSENNEFINLKRDELKDVYFSSDEDSIKITLRYKLENDERYLYLTNENGEIIKINDLNNEKDDNDLNNNGDANDSQDVYDSNDKNHSEDVNESDDINGSEDTSGLQDENDLHDGSDSQDLNDRDTLQDVSDSDEKENDIESSDVDEVNLDNNYQYTTRGSSTVPKGSVTLGDVFADPNSNSKKKEINIEEKQDDNNNNGAPYSELSLAGNSSWISIWSKEKYKVDFNNSFRGSMYINFGTAALDGFAFVLHNDANGTKALTEANDKSTDGQNLGVYGDSKASKFPVIGTEHTPEETAIKNSVAIEFDLYKNVHDRNILGGATGDSLYDEGISGIPHMAYSFPGSTTSYVPVSDKGVDKSDWFPLVGSPRKARVVHNEPVVIDESITTNIQDNSWYEFVYEFYRIDKQSGNNSYIEYYLKNPVNGAKTRTVRISWSELNRNLKLSDNNNKAYWGFTAANGKAKGETKFVFSELPVDVNVDVDNDVKDEKGNSIAVQSNDESMNPFVEKGKDIMISSKVSLKSDESEMYIKSWFSKLDSELFVLDEANSIRNIKAIRENGSEIEYSSYEVNDGIIKVYFDKVQIAPGESITLSYELTTQKGNNNDENYQKSIKTSYFSTVVADNEKIKKTGTFQGHETFFWIRDVYKTELAWDEEGNDDLQTTVFNDMSEIPDEGIELNFFWKNKTENSTVDFILENDGKEIDRIEGVKSNGEDVYKNQKMIIPKAYFKDVKNSFTVKAIDSAWSPDDPDEEYAYLSSEFNYKALILEYVPESLNWTNRNGKETKGVLARDDDNIMKLRVMDSRDEDSTWSIGARINKLNEDQHFNMIWKSENSSDPIIMSEKNIYILNKNSAGNPTNYIYRKDWGKDEGVLIQSDEYLKTKDYNDELEIVWTLFDTPNID